MKNILTLLFASMGVVVSAHMIILLSRHSDSWLAAIIAIVFTAAALSTVKEYLTK